MHVQRAGQPGRDVHDAGGNAFSQVRRREERDAITGVYAGPLHVFHNPRNQHGRPVGDRIDLDLQPLHVPVDE